MKKALITGITGQDGSYLAELLIEKGYEVHGIVRRSSTPNTGRIENLKAKLHFGDLADYGSLEKIMAEVKPDEIYNLGAQSHVRVSFDVPEYTGNITGLGTLRLLEAMRNHVPKARFYQASSSEMYGDVKETPQTETTPFNAQSPYGIAKVFAHDIAKRYREGYGLFIACGILFNHESPRRGELFVTRKIAIAAAMIAKGLQETLIVGNLDAKRDWGYAPEYCDAMWRMLQQKKADDFVIATGETHTVREFIEKAFSRAGITIVWKGKGVKEQGIDKKTGKTVVTIDPVLFRPNEVSLLIGNPGKAQRVLKWKPKVTFKELVDLMVDAELAILQRS